MQLFLRRFSRSLGREKLPRPRFITPREIRREEDEKGDDDHNGHDFLASHLEGRSRAILAPV
jgi:hypothetical protein